MSIDESRALPEYPEGFSERAVAFLGGSVEPIVGGHFASDLPDRLHRIEFGRVGRQAMQFDAMSVLAEPFLPVLVEVVAGTIVRNEEDLLGVPGNQELQERQVGLGVEDRS